jgi:hypothetical protein
MNDLLKAQMQETGRCRVEGLTVLEIAEIVSDLGLSSRSTRVRAVTAGELGTWLETSDQRLMGGRAVTLH